VLQGDSWMMDSASVTPHTFSDLSGLLISAAEMAGCHDVEPLKEALQRAAFAQQSPVAAILVTNLVSEGLFLESLASLLGMPWRNESSVLPAENVRTVFPSRLALGFQVLPERSEEETEALSLMTWDPFDHAAWQAITHHHPGPVRLVMTTRKRLTEAVKEAYGVGAETFDELLEGREEEVQSQGEEVNVLDGEDPDASVMKFVNQILREGLQRLLPGWAKGASAGQAGTGP
jgi:hypothetical protein